MNAPVIVCLVACIAAGMYALYLRNLEHIPADPKPYYAHKTSHPKPTLCNPCIDLYGYEAVMAEYHLMHGPRSGCSDCEDK